MKCAWQEYLTLLPSWLRAQIEGDCDKQLLELRLRRDKPPELIYKKERKWLKQPIRDKDLEACINIACRYSPWSTETVNNFYITAQGGHRIGICGTVNMDNGAIKGIRDITSIAIRVSKDFPGIAAGAPVKGSTLILGAPGSGKTTLLRDLIRMRSEIRTETIAVVDEREEIFPKSGGHFCYSTGKSVDILHGCPKSQGIDRLLKVMTPDVIAIDEITSRSDCMAILSAGWCGVDLLATAHAVSVSDLKQRAIYRPILESKLFSDVMVLDKSKNWHTEKLYS